MKYTFNQFKKLLFESLLDEDKSRLIDRLALPDIDSEEEKQKAREEMKIFFNKYSNFENRLDWNRPKTITYADFERIKDLATQTKGAQKREIALDIKNIFKSIGYRKFEIVGENKNWLFVAPLSWEAAVYCDSSTNQGGGAKWCIGQSVDASTWKGYINQGSVFVMAFNKNYKSLSKEELQTNLKYMIQKDNYGHYVVWNQEDHSGTELLKFTDDIGFIDQIFDKAKHSLELVKAELKKEVKIQFKKKIENLKNITKLLEDYFTDDEKELITTIELPENITYIGSNVFRVCRNLTNIRLPSGIKEIGSWAFENCVNLTKIKIPNNVTYIGDGAFFNCYKLSDIKLPNNIKQINSRTFYNCSSLSNIIIPDKVTSIAENAFQGCIELINIIIPNHVLSIKEGAFAKCDNLKNVIIGDKVGTIQKLAFSRCNNLENVTILSNIRNIGKGAFFKCENLKNVNFVGKTLEDVKMMNYYPWGIENHTEEIITAKK